MHRLVPFHAINRAAAVSEDAIEPPETGNLKPDLLRILCAAFAEHTTTPESCWFCLWDGYGWLHDRCLSTLELSPEGDFASPVSTRAGAADSSWVSPVLRAAVRNAPRVHLPNRHYLLFEGPLEAATELGWNLPGGRFVPQSPNLFWPQDHAWCVASEMTFVAPWSPVRTLWPKTSWLTRASSFGGSSLATL